jgi:hypothetical protein
MAGFSSWVDGNFNLIQTVGIIGSLWMGILAARREAKAKEVENLLSISDHHRELWDEALHKADLQRISLRDADLAANPVTVAEEEFLNLVIAHFAAARLLASSKVM